MDRRRQSQGQCLEGGEEEAQPLEGNDPLHAVQHCPAKRRLMVAGTIFVAALTVLSGALFARNHYHRAAQYLPAETYLASATPTPDPHTFLALPASPGPRRAAEHYHFAFRVVVKGVRSYKPPFALGFDRNKGRFVYVHTHDNSGTVHVETPPSVNVACPTPSLLLKMWLGSKTDALRNLTGRPMQLFVGRKRVATNKAALRWRLCRNNSDGRDVQLWVSPPRTVQPFDPLPLVAEDLTRTAK